MQEPTVSIDHALFVLLEQLVELVPDLVWYVKRPGRPIEAAARENLRLPRRPTVTAQAEVELGRKYFRENDPNTNVFPRKSKISPTCVIFQNRKHFAEFSTFA
jgi:hypothetical protein